MTRLFVADDKFPDVIAQLQARGWTRFPHDSFPNFDLRWTNYAKIAWSRVRAHQIVNHFHGAVVLSRKNVLAARLYSNALNNDVDAFFPRTLDLTEPSDKDKLVAWFLYARAVGVVGAAGDHAKSSVTSNEIDAAVAYLERILQLDGFFSCWSASTLDLSALELESEQWKPLRRKSGSSTSDSNPEPVLSTAKQEQLKTIRHRLSELDVQIDCIAPGHGDVWICKPTNLSQGRGIHLVTDLDELLQLVPSEPPAKSESSDQVATSWVVQKYIERPLLHQNGGAHKFDVRQWVLLTSLDPLTVYWYKDCYLRFCSRPFSLENDVLGDRFTHLSNYSVQKDANGSCQQIVDSMWTSSRFRDALCQEHGRDVWTETIVPQMQHAALTAIKAALPDLRPVGRGFEWLGIDFLIDADLRVWLLEVNVSPDVSHSTDVTASLVPDATRGVLDLVLGEEHSNEASANAWNKMATS